MRFRFIARRPDHQRLRDDRIYDEELPGERDVLEITIARERMKVCVISIHWPDRTDATPAEVMVEEIL
jgi:hypothetical protein